MPNRDVAATPGTPCWMDLSTSDIAKSKAFYQGLFGWSASDSGPEFGGYVLFELNGRPVGGAMQAMTPDTPDGWGVYLASADNDATIAAAVAAGATIFAENIPVGDLGKMAFLNDPSGAMVGLWEAGQHLGFGVVAEAGAPAWHENYTPNLRSSTDFYSAIFDYGVNPMGDTDEFRYATLQVNGEDVAGVMEITKYFPEGYQPHWQNYICVADTDASIAKVIELGGSVLDGPDDSPYGRMATIVDPTGAIFKIIADQPESQ